jgi:hypothetical protein
MTDIDYQPSFYSFVPGIFSERKFLKLIVCASDKRNFEIQELNFFGVEWPY